MPRDGVGNFTLAPGNPVVPGTVIEAAWANPTLSDIAGALTDSLSRTGAGGMLVPFRNTDGTVGAPGMSWANEPSSGWYRAGLNDFWYSVGNENIFRITKTTVELAPGKTFVGFAAGAVTLLSAVIGNAASVPASIRNGEVLQLHASATFGGMSMTTWAAAAGSTSSLLDFNRSRSDAIGTMTAVALGDGLGFIAFRGSDGTNFLTAAQISAIVGNNPGANDMPGSLIFSTTADGAAAATERMRIDYAGVVTLATGPLKFSTNSEITLTTVDGADTGDLHLCGGGAASVSRGGFVRVNGNEQATFPGQIILNAGNVLGGVISFYGGQGVSNAEQLRVFPLSAAETYWSFAGGKGSTTTLAQCILSTADGADNSGMIFCGGGAASQGRGASFQLHGNEFLSDGGSVFLRTGNISTAHIYFYTNTVFRAAILGTGHMAYASDGSTAYLTSLFYSFKQATSGQRSIMVDASTANPNGIFIAYSGSAPNGGGNNFCMGFDTAATRFELRSNGGLANFAGNNVNLSDATVKSELTPVTPEHMAQLWAAHKAIDWSHYKYTDQTHDDPNFGYTAQGIAAAFATAAPWLVDEWQMIGGMTKLAVYQEDLHNITGAIVSELQRRVEALEATP